MEDDNTVKGDVTIEHAETHVEHTETTTIPKAHPANQTSSSSSESGPSFSPRNNSASNADFNRHNNPALGTKRTNDLNKPSSLDDQDKDKLDDKNKDKPDDKDKNNQGNQNQGQPSSDTDKNSLPGADPNTNMNANAADMNNKNNSLNSPKGDKDFDPKKQKDNPNKNSESSKKLATGGKEKISESAKESSKGKLASTFKEMWENPEIRRKIIIGAGIVFGVFFFFLVIITLLTSLGVILSSSMCDDNSGSFTYSGSGDIAEFMCGMVSPVENYTVTSKYGYNVDSVHAGRLHSGIDLAVSTGTPVYAAQSGKVVAVNSTGLDMTTGYGHDVVIDHGGGIFTRYGHNSKLLVNKGDFVQKGQKIAEAGSTGHSTGPHGHFEILKTTEDSLFSGHQDPNAYFVQHEQFMSSCGSSASATYMSYTPSSVETVTIDSYSKIKNLKTLTATTGTIKKLPATNLVFQSFAYNNGSYYLQKIHDGSNGKDGFIYKFDSNLKQQNLSPKSQAVGHGNGLTYCTADNKLYSVTVSGIRNNRKATIIDPNTLAVTGHKNLDHGTSAIAYDRLTNRFITSSGAPDNKASTTAYLYVYDSKLSEPTGAQKIAKKRWKTPADIAAYGGIIYVAISSYNSGGNGNYIDMYNEDTGDYLGSYSAPYYEIEGVDIDADGQLVLLFHKPNAPFLQFTGIKAKVINNSGGSYSSTSNDVGGQCCTETSSYTVSSSGEYCPNGITVTGAFAGTYSLDEYVERVVTAENGGANEEALKALAVAARTYAVNRTDNCTKTIPNSTAAQVMADKPTERVSNALQSVRGSVMLYNGNYFSAEYSSFLGTCSGDTCSSTFVKVPSNEKATFTMPKKYLTLNAGHERGLSQNGSNYMASQGKTYQEILEFFYADGIQITGASASSSSCSLGGSGTYSGGKIWDYNQADYNDAYCGGTIANSGCGPTAMAMVVSTFSNEKHDPSELAKIASDTNHCSTNARQYFVDAANKYGLKIKQTEEHEEALAALNRGDSLVIVNVTSKSTDTSLLPTNYWTKGGHYIVMAGHSGRNVWVQDPNKSTSGRGNTNGDGVYNFDKQIVPAAWWYSIISKA